MTQGKITLKTFVGFQLTSRFHSPTHFQAMGDALNARLKRMNKLIDLELEYGLFPPGCRLWDQILDKIEASQITIFDISENNPNVLIEAGIALGTGKHVIFLKCQQSEVSYPTDIHDFVFLPYHSSGTLTEESFLQKITDSIQYFLDDSHDPYFYHRLIWALSANSKTLIIPGTLPESYTGNRFEDYIRLRTHGDLDAIFTVMETIHRLYPRMEILIQSANSINSLPRDWEESNIVFVGGPDFNGVVREFDQMCPIEYKYSDAEVWLQHRTTGKSYRPLFFEQGGQRHALDYGFFLTRKPSEYHSTKMIFIGGARTWGVYGAALLVSCTAFDKKASGYGNAKRLVGRFGSAPSLLVPVEVTGSKDGIHLPKWSLDEVECLD